MSRLIDESWSKTGDEGRQNRVTKIYEDGSRREITERADGGVTITDVDSNGRTRTGDGSRGLFNTLSGSVRLNTTSQGHTTPGS